MAARRGSSGFGPLPIGWDEIDAFCRLTGTRLAPWEVEFIEALDDLWMAESWKNSKSRGKPEPGKPKIYVVKDD
jgi:hypothetical protein